MSSSQEEDNTAETSHNVECPVCKEPWQVPRMFPCGHSVCQTCMQANDLVEEQEAEHENFSPAYRCPMCRAETLLPWHGRPVNRALCDAVGCPVKNEVTTQETEDAEEDGNLAALSLASRRMLAGELLKEVVPLLRDAATRGRSYVMFRGETSRRVYDVCGAFTQMLFDKYGVYGVEASKTETVVHLVASASPWRGVYVNERYTEQLQSEGHADAASSELPSDRTLGMREHRALQTRSMIIRMLENASE